MLLLLLCSQARADAYADSLRLVLRIAKQAHFAACDGFSNLYLVTAQNRVEKYDSTGRMVAFYANNRLGAATALDLKNPLKITLWYADQQQVVFLDRTLSEIGSLNLQSIGFQQITAVASSADGNLWAYDAADFRLYKITPEGTRIFEGQATNLFDLPPRNPTQLAERDDVLWMADTTLGIWAFDLFAQLKKTSLLTAPIRQFEVLEGRMAHVTDRDLSQQSSTLDLQFTKKTLPKVGNWAISRRFLIFMGAESVELYAL